MRYRLREGLHYCIAGANVILLDTRRNRYCALSPAAGTAFQRIAERGGLIVDEDEPALRGLIRNGLLAPIDRTEGGLGSARIAAPSADLLNEPRLSIPLRHVARALFWEARIALALRVWPLSSVLKRIGDRSLAIASVRPETARQTAALSQAFDRTAFVLGRTNRCLVRSLAMFCVLQNSGIPAQFVIGVRSQPFAAHAWVQHEHTVLNDGVEQVSCYVPILVLA